MRLIAILLCCSALLAGAQTPATTEDGRHVVLNADGTWTWAAEALAATPAAEDTACASLIVEGLDADGKPVRSSQLIMVSHDQGATGLALVLEGDTKKSPAALRIRCAGAKACVKKDAKVKLYFRDGSETMLASDAVANCKGDVPIFLGGSYHRKDLIAALTAKRVRAIRVWLGDEFVERELSEANGTTLMHSARCLLK